MIDQLRTLVDTDSGSYDKEGVDRVGAQLRAFLETAGLSCETFSSERYGDGLRAAPST
jgi:glutamate carboxypeptidase